MFCLYVCYLIFLLLFVLSLYSVYFAPIASNLTIFLLLKIHACDSISAECSAADELYALDCNSCISGLLVE